MTDNDQLDERLRKIVAEYHRPTEVPGDLMWEAIARERAARRGARRPAPGFRRLAAWGLAAAALVAVGVGLDRMIPRSAPTQPTLTAGPATPGTPSMADRLAAQNVFGKADVFLTGYRADIAHGRLDRTSPAEARQLLAATRLLLDSRAAADPRLRLLLEDLELTLARIAQDGANPQDARTISQDLEQRGVLTELRSKVRSGPAAAVSHGVI